MKTSSFGSGLRTEAIAGATTFFTMAYIVVVNPSVLTAQGTGMPFSGVMTATVLLSFVSTLLMGVYAKLPYAVASGMGLNAFFTYTLVLGKGVPWPTALGITFWAGVLFLLVSVTPLREAIARAVPQGLRVGSAAGIGIFLTFIGLKNSGFVVNHPVTSVKAGLITVPVLLSLGGFVLIGALLRKRNPFAFLAGIFAVTLVAWVMGLVKAPEQVFSMPDFSSAFLKMDPWGALKVSLIPAILAILFTDLFDSITSFVGMSHGAGLVDSKGNPKNLRQGLIVDSWATLLAGVFGTSSGTVFVESMAGVEVGGRTGKTAIFAALCFLPCLFIAPLAAMVPAYATAPVLVWVGVLMFRSVSSLKTENIEDLVPAFLAIILVPLTFSITQGLVWGFLSHLTFYWLAGRKSEITRTQIVICVLSVVILLIENSG
ncbi:MAG: NCS2 family permease [Bdellovibrionales bacterium]|nr:NCS2 family permease [Bdellovibrionales bacterium]